MGKGQQSLSRIARQPIGRIVGGEQMTRNQIKNLISILFLMTPSLSLAGTDGGVTTSTTSSSSGSAPSVTSVSGALGEAKKQNTLGMVANIAGAGLHGVSSYENFMKFKASCGTRGCTDYTSLGKSILHAALMASSFSQAGAHSNSNQQVIPELCKTSAGVCNPNDFKWPDIGQCSNNPSCISNVIKDSGNPELGKIYDPANPNNPLNQAKNLNEQLNKNGGSFDPNTGIMKINGRSYDTKKLLTDPNARNEAGISEEVFQSVMGKKGQIDSQTAALGSDPSVMAAMDAGLGGINGKDGSLAGNGKGGIDPLTGQPYSLGLDNLGSSEGSMNELGADGDMDAALRASALGRGAKGLKNGRVPAAIAGKKKMFNGEPIGVAGDSIFDMMTRRYQVKEMQNTFLDPALVDPK